MRPSLPPCPECSGKRVFFSSVSNPTIPFRFMWPIKVYWYICVECEHTTLRIHPDDLKKLHQAAEKSEGKAPKPCPECDGERVLFKCISNTGPLWVCTPLPEVKATPVFLYLWTCLRCGSIVARPHPKDADTLRKASENKYLRFF